jgi:hypothetical protein
MLKSPVMMSSEGDVIKSSRSEENSDRNFDMEEDGGR